MSSVLGAVGAAAVRTSPGGRAGTPASGPGAPRGTAAPARPGFAPNAETALALGVVAIVALLIMPLPPFLLDVFLSLSIGISIVVLLVTLASRDPLEFSVFPSLLLLLTLFRLGLNVSTTRLILSTGHAGQVIAAFGDFVIGGNIVVGLVIFLILVVINFMVITKGAGRIAEVAARFTLDAMPGRQMSIDADLGAGLIDEFEARRRREEIARYADFYGSMDGAAKFVRGDAMAGLVITVVNLVGGFVIGMTQHGMSAGESLTTFSTLTIGDGLVTQIPALVVSTAAGMLVTFGSGGFGMASSISGQLTRAPQAWWTAGGLLAALGLIPGLPTLPFIVLAAAAAGIGVAISRRPRPAAASAAAGGDARPDAADSHAATPMRDLLQVEPLELEIGYALVPLVDEAQGGDLLQRVAVLRKQIAYELGLIVPAVRIRDNIQLSANEYHVKLRGVRVAGSEIMPRMLLALDTSGGAVPIEGTPTVDPTFGIPAVWIPADRRLAAETAGWTVVEAVTVLATHLAETIREHAAELLGRQDVRALLDGLKETHPALVEDVVPGKLGLGTVQRVLQRLLREGIPIRDLAGILESLSDAAEQSKDPEVLCEQVRRTLAPVIAEVLGAQNAPIRAITIGPRLELALMQLFHPRREGVRTLEPEDLSQALQSLERIVQAERRDGQVPPLVTPPGLRLGVRRLVEPMLPRLPVVSLAELPPQTALHNLKTWELSHAA